MTGLPLRAIIWTYILVGRTHSDYRSILNLPIKGLFYPGTL